MRRLLCMKATFTVLGLSKRYRVQAMMLKLISTLVEVGIVAVLRLSQ